MLVRWRRRCASDKGDIARLHAFPFAKRGQMVRPGFRKEQSSRILYLSGKLIGTCGVDDFDS